MLQRKCLDLSWGDVAVGRARRTRSPQAAACTVEQLHVCWCPDSLYCLSAPSALDLLPLRTLALPTAFADTPKRP